MRRCRRARAPPRTSTRRLLPCTLQMSHRRGRGAPHDSSGACGCGRRGTVQQSKGVSRTLVSSCDQACLHALELRRNGQRTATIQVSHVDRSLSPLSVHTYLEPSAGGSGLRRAFLLVGRRALASFASLASLAPFLRMPYASANVTNTAERWRALGAHHATGGIEPQCS